LPLSNRILWSDIRADVADRFWAKVSIGNREHCWNWTGCRHPKGYGTFHLPKPNKVSKAHRVSYAMAYGEAPSGDVLVLHSCDNPSCVNPFHLSVGNNAENVRQRDERKRRAPPSGEINGFSKLDTWDVICIRADRRKQKDIAEDYGLRQCHVSRIKRREAWAHVPEFDF
jgi:hypothetical protein